MSPFRFSAVVSLLAIIGCGQDIVVDRGHIDLTQWDPRSPVVLNGDWEMYWQRLLSPVDMERSPSPKGDAFYEMPGYWNRFRLHGEPLGGPGYATFRMTVDLGQPRAGLALRLADSSTAYRLFVNGQLLASNGQVGTTPHGSKPAYRALVAEIPGAPSTLQLLWQVSNFHRSLGGPYNPVVLGSLSQVQMRHKTMVIADVAMLACLIFMSLYHLVLYLFGRRDRSYLFFAVLCFFWGIRVPVLGTSGKSINLLFPEFPWALQFKFELLILVWAVAVSLIYFSSILPREILPKTGRWGVATASVFSLFVVLNPTHIADLAGHPVEVFGVLVIAYCTIGCVRAVLSKRRSAWVNLLGCLVFATTGINDVLHDLGWINTTFLTPIGVLVFCVSQAVVLALQLQQAYVGLADKLAVEHELEVQRQREAEARILMEKERLAKLRYQLNPHFLFNSLTSIRGAILMDGKKARSMVSDLAEIFRRALTQGAADMISVRQELDTIDVFLRIERTRMGDNLQTQIECQEAAYQEQIPTLLLQPIVENAIKHGRQTAGGQLKVRIDVALDKKVLVISVGNTGKWVEPEGQPGASGFGLSILKERLERIYPQHQFATREQEGWVYVELRLPQGTQQGRLS